MLCSSVTTYPDFTTPPGAAPCFNFCRVVNYLCLLSKAADYKGIKWGGQPHKQVKYLLKILWLHPLRPAREIIDQY